IDLFQLVHRHLIDVQPTGRVEDDRVDERLLGAGQGIAANVHGSGRHLAVNGDVDLFAENLELIDGGGALQVGGDEHRLAAAPAQRQCQFAGGGGLALTLKAAEHNDGRPVLGEGDVGVHRPHQGN